MDPSQKTELLVVTEYFARNGGPTGMQAADLQKYMTDHCPDVTLRRLTINKPYRPGSVRPDRIANQLSMLFRLPFVLLFHRISCAMRGVKLIALATSLPVNFHIPTVIGCKLLRIPVGLWMWDAHPETESRLFRKKGFSLISDFLDWVDRWSTRLFKRIVVLDQAMAEDLLRRTGYGGLVSSIKEKKCCINLISTSNF